VRRHFLNTRALGTVTRRGVVQTLQQIGQSTEVVVAEISSARADHHRRIVRRDIGPLAWQSGELSRLIVEIDAVLAPCLAAID
jgi:hypothetical protein